MGRPRTTTEWAADPDRRFIAEVTGVREVSLHGKADRAYWRARLAPEGLAPAQRDGHAQVLVGAAAMRYRGLRFTEVSVSVLVTPPDTAAGPDAAFLVGAVTSSRILAVCERVLFRTPYRRARCRVSAAPVSLAVDAGGGAELAAEMGPGPPGGRTPVASDGGVWAGPIFLPAGRVFFARLAGHTTVVPFLPADDTVSVRPRPGADVFRALIDSRFVGREWVVRPDATHARSRTYSRGPTESP